MQTNFLDALDPAPAHTKSLHSPPAPARLARATDSQGSQRAAQEIADSGTAAAQAARIEAYVHAHPGRTCDEIANGLGDLDRVQVGKRLPHIPTIRKGDGTVERTCTVSKRKIATWWPKRTFEGADE